MKRSVAILALFAILFVATGCAHSTEFNVLGVSAGVNSRAHAWEEPHFTADLESNPVSSELGLGFITVGSNAGIVDNGQWVSVHCTVGPEETD